jgi:hypothetical protein
MHAVQSLSLCAFTQQMAMQPLNPAHKQADGGILCIHAKVVFAIQQNSLFSVKPAYFAAVAAAYLTLKDRHGMAADQCSSNNQTYVLLASQKQSDQRCLAPSAPCDTFMADTIPVHVP